jgi:hypothetical protein
MSRIGMLVALVACCTALAFAQNNAPASSAIPANQVQPARLQIARVSDGVLQGLVANRTLPVYPDEAMMQGIQGDAIFRIEVDETGKVVLGARVEGNPLLVAASVDALRGFRFRPYLLNGTPIRIESRLGFHFSLDKNASGVNGHVECMSSIPDRPAFRIRTRLLNDQGVLVVDPRKLSSVEPQLPPELAGKSGSVYLAITIGPDGKVQDVKVVGGDQPFISPVVAAVKQDVYEPQLVDGKPSVATTQANYHFGPRH